MATSGLIDKARLDLLAVDLLRPTLQPDIDANAQALVWRASEMLDQAAGLLSSAAAAQRKAETRKREWSMAPDQGAP